MSYVTEYFKHCINSMYYKRKEKTIFENDDIRVNKYHDSFYVKNRNVYVILTKDTCDKNIYSYILFNKRINLYVIRIKNINKDEILKAIETIKNSHTYNRVTFIHGFKISKFVLNTPEFFKDQHYHISITPYIKKIQNQKLNIQYIKNFLGEDAEHEFKDIVIHNYHKNLFLISTNDVRYLRDKNYDSNKIFFIYSNSPLYLSVNSLTMARNSLMNIK